MVPAEEALERLRTGNARFAAGAPRARAASPALLRELADGQRPFATILGCSDSRVPAEIVFDQGVGDLFVIRVAGNVVAPSQIGSVEFAGEAFGVRLVVVLGHSRCGAVLAVVDELSKPVADRSTNLRSIVDRVRPSVEEVLSKASDDRLVELAVRANIRRSVNELHHASEILRDKVERDEVRIVGAEYSLDTGLVEFLD